MQVGQSLFDFARSVNGPVMVCDSETCRWQITHGTGIPAIHPVELLSAAYGYEPEGALKNILTKEIGDSRSLHRDNINKNP